jgi:hypothetical protein
MSSKTSSSTNSNDDSVNQNKQGTSIDDINSSPVSKPKEREPDLRKDDQIMAEIKSTSEVTDKQALDVLQGSMKEIKRSVHEPELSPDVEDVGVHSPQTKADEVVEKGTLLELPISEKSYEQSKGAKVKGKAIDRAVVGVSSIAAFAIWVGRMVKMAHYHTKRIVFRKEKV